MRKPESSSALVAKAAAREDHIESPEKIKTTSGLNAISFNPEEFLSYVQDFNLTNSEKLELLEIVWRIVLSFVDLGFSMRSATEKSATSPILMDDAHSSMIPSANINKENDKQDTPAESAGKDSRHE